MKLFKKRDTHTSNLSTSPAGSFEKPASIQHQSPTPSATPGAQLSTANGAANPAMTTASVGRESALQYPWSSRRLSNSNPFPRYGHATNSQSSKDGGIYVFGGLVREVALNDLWVLTPQDMLAKPVSTTGDLPSPRVGHAALLIGNAFIVFGGDTKLNGDDRHPNNDDSLYLLNTTTKAWTVAKVAGAKPSGRYGHTLNMLGPKVLVFGGQVDGFFFNDLVAFDLNTLSSAAPRWELITPVEGSEPPPSRTNHVAIAHNDKLYVFGGTNGVEWFNDMWRFDPVTRSWQLLNCSGYVPQPREGHSASLVGDVIYVFGGRDVDGNDLGDLSAFKISSSRWFTFQNMGPGPSARSGHALCSVGKRIYVVGGEGASSRGDEQHAYILDTTKIKYPAETRNALKRNDSLTNGTKDIGIDGSPIPLRRVPESLQPSIRSVSGQSTTAPSRLPITSQQRPLTREMHHAPLEPRRSSSAAQQDRENGSRPPSAANQRIVSQPNPVHMTNHAALNDTTHRPNVKRSGSLDSMMDLNDVGAPATSVAEGQPKSRVDSRLNRVRSLEEIRNDRSQPSETQKIDEAIMGKPEVHKLAPALRHLDSGLIETRTTNSFNPSPQRMSRRISAQEEQSSYVTRIAWLEAELSLARKSGYLVSDASQEVEQYPPSTDPEIVNALVVLRNQVLALKQEMTTAKAESRELVNTATSERDVAMREAAFQRARSSAMVNMDTDRLRTIDYQRSEDLEARLVEAASQSRSLERQIFALQSELTSTKRTREDHDALIERHNRAATEAEQKHTELLSQHSLLRSTLVETQNNAQEHQAKRSQAESALAEREVDSIKLRELEEIHAKHMLAHAATNAATIAATARASESEVHLDQERQRTATLETEIAELRARLEATQAEMSNQVSLREKMEASMKAAQREAELSRAAMTAGIDDLVKYHSTRGPHDPVHHQASLDNLRRELQESKDLHSSSRTVSDTHVRDLDVAHARVQALEALQTKHSNDMLALQRRVANGQSELQDLRAKHVSLEEQYASKQSELDEANLKYSGLQKIATSRPCRRDSIEKRRSRNLTSPLPDGRNSQTPDAGRLRELEQKLVESLQLQKEMQASHAKATEEIQALTVRHSESIARQQESERRARSLEAEMQGRSQSSTSSREVHSPTSSRRDSTLRNTNKEAQLAQARAMEAEKQLSESTQNFKERLGQLEADYQNAVIYVRTTEKMLRRMKEELGKYKTANAKLQVQLTESAYGSRGVDHDALAASTTKMADLELQLSTIKAEKDELSVDLRRMKEQLEMTMSAHSNKVSTLEAQLISFKERSASLDECTAKSQQLEEDLEEAHLATHRLEFENRELERGMQESEAKVKLLLDQFEQSVDTYRRQSMLISGEPDHTTGRPSALQSAGVQHGDTDDDGLGVEHVLAPPILGGGGNQRTSSALDLLANELDQLRSHWESNNSRHSATYRSPDLDSDHDHATSVDFSPDPQHHQQHHHHRSPLASTASVGGLNLEAAAVNGENRDEKGEW